VLETIFDLAGVAPDPIGGDEVFRGHPLAVPPKGAGTIFYGIWPALVLSSAFFIRRRHL
jgi:hypothetical protein